MLLRQPSTDQVVNVQHKNAYPHDEKHIDLFLFLKLNALFVKGAKPVARIFVCRGIMQARASLIHRAKEKRYKILLCILPSVQT